MSCIFFLNFPSIYFRSVKGFKPKGNFQDTLYFLARISSSQRQFPHLTHETTFESWPGTGYQSHRFGEASHQTSGIWQTSPPTVTQGVKTPHFFSHTRGGNAGIVNLRYCLFSRLCMIDV